MNCVLFAGFDVQVQLRVSSRRLTIRNLPISINLVNSQETKFGFRHDRTLPMIALSWVGLAGERWFTGKVALGRGDDTVTGNHQFQNSAPILSTSMISCLIGQKQRYVRNERLCTRNHSVNSWFQTNVERWFSVHVQTTFTLMNSSRSYCSPVNLRTMLLY